MWQGQGKGREVQGAFALFSLYANLSLCNSFTTRPIPRCLHAGLGEENSLHPFWEIDVFTLTAHAPVFVFAW